MKEVVSCEVFDDWEGSEDILVEVSGKIIISGSSFNFFIKVFNETSYVEEVVVVSNDGESDRFRTLSEGLLVRITIVFDSSTFI